MSSTIKIPDALFAAVHKEALVRKTAPEDLVVEWLSERLNDDEEDQTEWLAALKAEAEAFAHCSWKIFLGKREKNSFMVFVLVTPTSPAREM